MNATRLVTGPLSVNTWVIPVGEGRAMVVDPGGNVDSIIAHLSERRSAPALVLLTHGHFDHLLALPALVRAFPGLPVAIHRDDAKFLGPGSLARHRAFLGESGPTGMLGQLREDLPAPAILLAEGEPIVVPAWGSSPGLAIPGWKVLHTPGHSEGSVCLYCEEERTLVSGDTLFFQGIGRTDFDGCSTERMFESLSRLALLPPETEVLPGHGRTTTIGAELR